MFFSVANLLNLEVDVIFFGSSSTYFEVEEEDEADAEQELEGPRRFGESRNLHEAARDAARRERALARIADELAALERKKTADDRRDAEALLSPTPRKDERIRAHVLLCFLALLLTRVLELETTQTWPMSRTALLLAGGAAVSWLSESSFRLHGCAGSRSWGQ